MVPPRPLAGLPRADPESVARAWLVRRIAAAPLEAAAALAGEDFARRGPGLCRALLAALTDDAALTALLREAGTLRALEPLAASEGAFAAGEGRRSSGASGAGAGPRSSGAPALVAMVEHLRGAVLDVVAPATDPALHAALHDRLAHACAALLEGALAAPEAIGADDALATRGAEAISVHDARATADPRGRLTAEAERLVVARVAFALLAVEIEDAAVVPASVLAAAEAALHAALPAGAVHAPDGPGSLLVLAREADGSRLARALTQAVGAAASHRGAPLRAAAGVAEHPRDGDTPEGLLAHADGQLFAARAEGLPLA